jgi:hypothetical protein
MLRDLNVIAPLVTMFFLITFLMINVVLLIESSLNLVSFRPTLTIPRLVPLSGALGCVLTMAVVNPIFGVIAVALVVAVYIYIAHQHLVGNEFDVRSSIFESMASWAAAKVVHLGGPNVRSWKPDVLFPVHGPAVARGAFRLLVELCKPEGSLDFIVVRTEGTPPELIEESKAIAEDFRGRGLFTRWAAIDSESFSTGVLLSLQALQSAMFRPNILFLVMPHEPGRHAELEGLIESARELGVGVLLLGRHVEAGLGEQASVNLWVRHSVAGWQADETFERNNVDLTLLMGYRLTRNWHAKLNVVTAVDEESERERGEAFLAEICELARLPHAVRREVLVGPFLDAIAAAPHSDLQILGLPPEPDCAFLEQIIERSSSSCLFVADSGRESARA